MPETMVKAESSNAWKVVAAVTLMAVVFVAVLSFAVTQKFGDTTSALDRQDCIVHINARFFGHLADALSKEPASTQRQYFLDQMKADATALKRLDVTCPGG